MKRLIPILILILSCLDVIAQQDPLITHIFFNRVYINPAFAGQDGDICANIISRQQWIGFTGAPKTTLITLNSPIKVFGKQGGVGLQITDDRLGFEKNFFGSLQYAYYTNIQNGTLSIGIQLGVFNKAYDANWLTPDGTSGSSSDPALPNEKDHSMTFDMAFGVVYTVNNLYIGLSADHLTQSKFKFASSEIPYLKRHYYLMSGYKFAFSNSPFEITPNLIVKYDGSSPQIALNVNTLYNKKFWGGVTYRPIDGVDLNVGIELFNGLKIGIAYGLNFSKLIKTNTGSSEVMIGYNFNFGIPSNPQKYRSVRFL